MASKEVLMKKATREWLSNLIVDRKNSKAIEIRDYIAHLESELKRVLGERLTLQPMSSAPSDGTEILAYHIEGKNLHPIYWRDQRWADGGTEHWGMRWNDEHRAYDGCYKGWMPYPVIDIKEYANAKN